MDSREQNLPKWAQDIINHLRKRVQYGNEPLIAELAKLRPKVEALKAKNDALIELLQAAARGGHMTSSDIITVITEYAPWKD